MPMLEVKNNRFRDRKFLTFSNVRRSSLYNNFSQFKLSIKIENFEVCLERVLSIIDSINTLKLLGSRSIS